MKTLAAFLATGLAFAAPALAQDRSQPAEPCETCTDGLTAWFQEPVARYGHNVLGNTPEWVVLALKVGDQEIHHTLPDNRVFEDIAPRLADLDGDGQAEVIVVESDTRLGAQLAVYDIDGKRAETPFIGQSFRWLAPVGVGDLNGDGQQDLAYVETPHLGKMLRIWTYQDGALVELGRVSGVTNHRIGEPFITSGIKTCGSETEILLASADWSAMISVHFKDGELRAERLFAWPGRAGLNATLAC